MTTADFIDVGTSLDLIEALMMSVIVGSRLICMGQCMYVCIKLCL